MTTCPVHPLAVQAHGGGGVGRPSSRFYETIHRIADRMEPEIRAAFLGAVEQVRDQIDLGALEQAVRAGDEAAIATALRLGSLEKVLSEQQGIRRAFQGTYTATGEAAADVLADALALDFAFDTRDPEAIVFARRQAGRLITQITDDQLLMVRGILGRAQSEGLPVRQTARLIRDVVGIRADWAAAPLNLRAEIEAGRVAAATGRRLDAATKARIRARIKAGTVTEEFLDEVQAKYAASLRNRRALDISRTEGLRSANAGTQRSWVQARDRGVLPATARKFPVVTPDDRLRETHAETPFLNPDGVAIDEPFETPFGLLMYPPWEPLCRCGVGLVPNPQTGGMI